MQSSMMNLLIILSLLPFSTELVLNNNNFSTTPLNRPSQKTTAKPTMRVVTNKTNNIKPDVTKSSQGGTIKVAVVTNKPIASTTVQSNIIKPITITNKEKNIATTPIPARVKENLQNRTATKKPEKSEHGKKEHYYPRGSVNLNVDNICTCNLQRYICDINCCCDSDCKESDKKIFEFCETDTNRYYDDSFCDYARHIYINNTPYQWEVNQRGMFCVAKTNQPKSYLMQKKQPVKSFRSAEIEKHGETFWNIYDQPLDMNNEFKTTTYGDPVWILGKDDDRRKLAIPKSYLTSSCIYEEEISYLKEAKSFCSQINIDEQNSFLNFASYTLDKKVISHPQYLNNITNGSNFSDNIYQACPKSLCLPIDAYVCDISFLDCKHFHPNFSNFNCSFDIRKNLMTCLNAVKKLHYNFYHNGSIGLVKVEVKSVLQNFSFKFEKESFEFEQDFSVNFKWIHQRENASDILSGNPGYIIGKPILIGTHVLFGNSSVIVRNSTKFVNNFLTLPAVKNGQCIFNDAHYEYTPIEFGYNTISKCQLKQQITVVRNKSFNANESCQTIQLKILENLRIPVNINQTLVVGLFGNALPFDKKAWNEVLFEVTPINFVVNRTSGNFTHQNRTLNCIGILTMVSIDVLYSRVDFEDLVNQNKILALEYRFQNLKNLTFDVKNNLTIDLDLVIHSKVAFFDITTEKKRKFVEAPSFKIKLPYDFFYPFIKIDNSGHSFGGNAVLSVVCFIFLKFGF